MSALGPPCLQGHPVYGDYVAGLISKGITRPQVGRESCSHEMGLESAAGLFWQEALGQERPPCYKAMIQLPFFGEGQGSSSKDEALPDTSITSPHREALTWVTTRPSHL